MTVHKVVILECESCGTTALPETLIVKDLIHLMTGPPSGVTDARHMAALKGWRHTASGKDLCPPCQSAKRAPAKTVGLLAHIPHPRWRHE
jgi:hypothetical protein